MKAHTTNIKHSTAPSIGNVLRRTRLVPDEKHLCIMFEQRGNGNLGIFEAGFPTQAVMNARFKELINQADLFYSDQVTDEQ